MKMKMKKTTRTSVGGGLVVVSETNCGGGEEGYLCACDWMCDTLGWWPEGAEDHVSLLISECIWDQSLQNEAPCVTWTMIRASKLPLPHPQHPVSTRGQTLRVGLWILIQFRNKLNFDEHFSSQEDGWTVCHVFYSDQSLKQADFSGKFLSSWGYKAVKSPGFFG